MTEKTTLNMERTYQAPAEAVFDAWTSEEVIRRWRAEHDWETTEADVDLGVGGVVRVVMLELMQQYLEAGGQQRRIHRASMPKRVQAALTARNASPNARLGETTWAEWLLANSYVTPTSSATPIGSPSSS